MFILTPIVLAILVSTAINIFVTVVSWQRRKTRYGLYFALGMTGVTFWTLMSALDYAATPLNLKVLFATLEGWGYMSAHPYFAMFAMSFAGYDRILDKRWVKAFFVFVPVTNILWVTTNSLHGLVWQEFIQKTENVVVFVHGPAYGWIYVSSNLLTLIIIISLAMASFRGAAFSRKQGQILLASILFTEGTNIAYNLSFGMDGVDWTSVAFSATGALFLWALYGQKFLDIIPIAREKLIDSLGDGMIALDIQARIVDLNQPAAQMLGSLPEKIVGRNLDDFVPLSKSLSGYLQEQDIRTEIETGIAEKRYFDVLITPLFENGTQVVGRLIIFRNITARKQNELRLLQLNQAVEQSPVSVIITDLDGNITYVNSRFTTLTAYTLDDVLGKNPRILQSGQTPIEVYRNLWQTINAGKIWKGEFLNKKKNGELYWEDATIAPVLDHNGRTLNFIAVKEDITERKHAQDELQKLARTDSLTGLFNRRHFFEIAEKEFAKSIRYHRPLSVILFDIDLFKDINDTYGHIIGDQVLIQIGKLLLERGRQTDMAARYGGEEFVILLTETNCVDAKIVAERLRKLVEESPIHNDKGTIHLTASFGVAGMGKDPTTKTLDRLISQADQALYEAKRTGRNQVVCYQ